MGFKRCLLKKCETYKNNYSRLPPSPSYWQLATVDRQTNTIDNSISTTSSLQANTGRTACEVRCRQRRRKGKYNNWNNIIRFVDYLSYLSSLYLNNVAAVMVFCLGTLSHTFATFTNATIVVAIAYQWVLVAQSCCQRFEIITKGTGTAK